MAQLCIAMLASMPALLGHTVGEAYEKFERVPGVSDATLCACDRLTVMSADTPAVTLQRFRPLMDTRCGEAVAPVELDLAGIRAACVRARVRASNADWTLPLDAAIALLDRLEAGVAW